jgi:hypothetical protein
MTMRLGIRVQLLALEHCWSISHARNTMSTVKIKVYKQDFVFDDSSEFLKIPKLKQNERDRLV